MTQSKIPETLIESWLPIEALAGLDDHPAADLLPARLVDAATADYRPGRHFSQLLSD